MNDYIELEYIESSGTQYINTNYIFNGIKNKIYADFVINEFVNSGWVTLCATQKNSSTRFGAIQFYGYKNYLTAGDKAGDNGINLGDTLLNTRYQIEVITNTTTQKLNVERSDNKIGELTITGSVRTDLPIYIFCKNTNSTTNENIKAKLYRYKIMEDDVLVRDFIPVKRKSDNKVCLYDKVSKTYFTNQGTGNFIAGPELLIANIQSIQTQVTKLNNLCENILGIPSYEIVPFATATDAQISALLDAHYAGTIDLSEIWNVGDTRVIHLDAMSAPVPGSNKAHVAQDMTFRIIGFNHDNLTTQIGNVTKAAVTIECKELLGNHGTLEDDYLSASSKGSVYENPVYFDNAYRRTWLNNNFISALPSTFSTLIKEVVKRNLQGHDNTTNYIETNDKAFLLSYPEIFSSTYNHYRNGATLNDYEGTQYSYYNQNDSNAGRIKYVNNNGSASSTANHYWLRSPSSYTSNHWCSVYNIGSAGGSHYIFTCGLSPALAI